MQFSKAIVRLPSPSMIDGITSADLGIPNYPLALIQHMKYVKALEQCGLEVEVLVSDPNFPDGCFVEDVAVCFPDFTVITRPGAASRRDEIIGIDHVIGQFYEKIYRIEAPGTLEGGDIMVAGQHVYIGISERTNEVGAQQLTSILERHGYKGIQIAMEEMLHLKTGLSYLENNNLLITGEFLGKAAFSEYNQIIVPNEDNYAANSVWINGNVLVPMGNAGLVKQLAILGYNIIELDVSEFKKLDGGLSCLSLRF